MIKKRKCISCKGTGTDEEGETCLECDGWGEVEDVETDMDR